MDLAFDPDQVYAAVVVPEMVPDDRVVVVVVDESRTVDVLDTVVAAIVVADIVGVVVAADDIADVVVVVEVAWVASLDPAVVRHPFEVVALDPQLALMADCWYHILVEMNQVPEHMKT